MTPSYWRGTAIPWEPLAHEIKADGHLKLTNIGGMQANNAEAENVRVITKFNGIYEGTCQLANPSVSCERKLWDHTQAPGM